MTTTNRIVLIAVFLIGLAVCGLVIRQMDADLHQTTTRLMAVESELASVQATLEVFQTSTVQTLDVVNSDVEDLEVLVEDLGLQLSNQ